MKTLKPTTVLGHITLIQYEAVRVLNRPFQAIHREYPEKKAVYGYKEVARWTFDSEAQVCKFLKTFWLGSQYRGYTKWSLPSQPSGERIHELCITNHSGTVSNNAPVKSQSRRYHTGYKRRKTRHQCGCWYCMSPAVKLDLNPRKAQRLLKQLGVLDQ